MTGGGGARPRRVCVTRVGGDVFLVVVGDVTVAVSWLELTALAAEVSEALDVSGPCRRPRGSWPHGE